MRRLIPFAIVLAALAAVVLAALLSGGAWAQQVPGPYKDSRTIPDTPAYRRALEIKDLVNKGDAAAVEAYARANFAREFLEAFPLAEHTGMFARVHSVNGELEIVAARTYDPPRPVSQAVLILRGELSEAWRAIVCEVDEAPPHRIVSLQFAPARQPSDLPPAKELADAEIAKDLGAYVDRLAAQELFSGTVLVAKDGKPIVTKAVGLANRDFDAPVALDTKFNLGSMNKMMTGVACMQLVEAGKLSLEDPVSKYLGDDWLPKVDKSKVRVKHLLTHTSGLGSYFTEEWQRSSRALYRSIEDWKPICKDETLAFEPGTNWQYSNTGMLIAGAVVEKASGMDYYEYVRTRITGPAGMTNSDFYETDLVNKNLAVGYEREQGPGGRAVYRNNLYAHVVRGGPAGGGYSTVEDLLKFDQALRGGILLKKESLAELWRAYPEIGSQEYGLGWGIDERMGGKVVGHTGGFDGISAAFNMYLDAGYTVVTLSNMGGAAQLVQDKARALIEQGRGPK
jgi:CubicO group peptidase (beta-lactamase class C family)